MAHIPYGYRIEQGKAVPDPEQAKQFNCFLATYLSGKSVSMAMLESGVDMSVSGMQDYMRRGIYNGTSYFPRIVPEGTLERVRAEMERRSHPGTQKMKPPVPVRTHFKLGSIRVNAPICSASLNSASDIASALYDRILPAAASDGVQSSRQLASSAEMKALRTLAKELILTGHFCGQYPG